MARDRPGPQGRKQLNKNQIFKRERIRNARTIRAEAVNFDDHKTPGNESKRDLSESGGMLQIKDFISSREYEIKQLQLAMHKSKTAGCTRIFQALPRAMRRRTASHNVKRIPKRMRSRALREMLKNDQEITAKGKSNKGKNGLTTSQLYRAKMSVQLLRLVGKSTSMQLALPEEVTASGCHLRTKIRRLKKLIRAGNHDRPQCNNKLGSYDNAAVDKLAPLPRGRIKYLKRQKFFTWLPTHIWNAKRSHMMKRWGYHLAWSPTQKCFRATHRIGGNVSTSDGVLCMDTSFYGTMLISGVGLVQAVSALTAKRALKKKYRDSKTWFEGLAYDVKDTSTILGPLELLWVDENLVLLRLHPAIYPTVFSALRNTFHDDVSIQDCRFALGSIVLKGAKSLAAVSSILRSSDQCRSFEQLRSVARVADQSIFPQRTMFAFMCVDPRHLGAPKSIADSRIPTADDVINLQTNFPQEEVAHVLTKLCDPHARNESYKNQQTLKELAQRRRELLGDDPKEGLKNCIPYMADKDPAFPLLIIRRPQSDDWLVIMPWFWLMPLWFQLNRVSRVHNVGLRQAQQLRYERRSLYFPDDYPFTAIGYAENSLYKREAANAKWSRKPPSKRVNFEKITNMHRDHVPACSGELGDYFSCDWKLLQILRNGIKYLERNGEIKLCSPERTTQFDSNGARSINVVNDIFELYKDLSKHESGDTPPICFSKNCENESSQKPAQLNISETPLQVMPISCTYLERGRSRDNARIYQIPEEHLDYWKRLNKGIFRANGKLEHKVQHPLPSVTDLIGFVTSGSYHLGEGRSVANGYIDAEAASKQSSNYVVIRNVGTNVYRLASWSHVSL